MSTVADNMNQFRNQSFAARMGAMGDEAEFAFESAHQGGFVRFGLNRPPVAVQQLPPQIRYTPDYLTSSGFVEVQGVGRDRIAKIKIEKAVALQQWHSIFNLEMFIWDSKTKTHRYLPWAELWPTLPSLPIAFFPEGKPYWELNIDNCEMGHV
jgi:hypothetical protein